MIEAETPLRTRYYKRTNSFVIIVDTTPKSKLRFVQFSKWRIPCRISIKRCHHLGEIGHGELIKNSTNGSY